MISQISLIFILFIILLSTVFVFIKKNPTFKENFDLPTQVAANVPAMNNTKGNNFFVGNLEPELKDNPIVESKGFYQFMKPQLLYDGVWGEQCKLNGKGEMKCDWEVKDANCPLDDAELVYGTNKFFQNPRKLGMGDEIIQEPDCKMTDKMYQNGPTYLENNIRNPPMYLSKPSAEDILGFDPAKQDNNLYWDKPGVILGYLPKDE